MPFANLNIGCPRSLAFGDRGDDLIVLLCTPLQSSMLGAPSLAFGDRGDQAPSISVP